LSLQQANKYTNNGKNIMKSSEFIKEDATGGASCSGAVATVVGELGGSTKEIIKRQKGYTNQRTPGSIVKGVKAAKVK
jgi:hypothetical protein